MQDGRISCSDVFNAVMACLAEVDNLISCACFVAVLVLVRHWHLDNMLDQGLNSGGGGGNFTAGGANMTTSTTSSGGRTSRA